MSIEALNLAARIAVLSDGSTVPITNLFDALGDETDNPNDAESFVCGSGAMWLSDRTERFQTVSVH